MSKCSEQAANEHPNLLPLQSDAGKHFLWTRALNIAYVCLKKSWHECIRVWKLCTWLPVNCMRCLNTFKLIEGRVCSPLVVYKWVSITITLRRISSCTISNMFPVISLGCHWNLCSRLPKTLSQLLNKTNVHMDSKKSKKVVGKDDLRRLMKETRGSIKKETKKIDSSLAKYPLLQLPCVMWSL